MNWSKFANYQTIYSNFVLSILIEVHVTNIHINVLIYRHYPTCSEILKNIQSRDICIQMQYQVNVRTLMAAILFHEGRPKSLQHLKVISKLKSMGNVVFKISRSQVISYIGYNVNFQIVMAPILFYAERQKSIGSEVFLV